MNVTFLIGNGFDLNYDLKTGYKDFYDYYCNLTSSKGDMLASAIRKDYKNWSDLEMGLADFVNSLDICQIDEFIESKVCLEDGLVEYLKKQERRALFADEACVAEKFKSKILNFYENLNAEWREEYKAVQKKQTVLYNMNSSHSIIQRFSINWWNYVVENIGPFPVIQPDQLLIRMLFFLLCTFMGRYLKI